MATKKKQSSVDAAAAKAKKQKMILIGGAVLLVALGALQGPKLLKGGGAAAADAPAASAPADASGSPSGGASTTPQVAVVKTGGSGPTAVLAGVSIRGGAGVGVGPAQLRTFTLFEAKDPFVQQASTETSGTTEPTSTPTLSDTEPGKSGAKGTTPKDGATPGNPRGAGATPAPPPAPPTYATVMMNGKAYYLTLKEPFPTADPLFVLAKLKSKVARIGIAGGAFADGKTIPLVKGKTITLVNDATGARYVLKLVYTGTTPEQTESFTQAAK